MNTKRNPVGKRNPDPKNPTLSAVLDRLGFTFPEPAETMFNGRVYFIFDPNTTQIKIGYTGNLQRRLSQLRIERGQQLELLGHVRANQDLEHLLHQRFAAHRVAGNEWYTTKILPEVHAILDPGMTRLIAALDKRPIESA